jgi:hypothetical protein
MWCFSYPTLAAYLGAFVATLVLARYLTPARWWRQANARALAVLAGGTWALGALLAMAGARLLPTAAGACLFSHTLPAPQLAAAPATPRAPVHAGTVAGATRAPAVGTRYTVAQALNLRAAPGVSSHRIATVPAHATVTATGVFTGDWWQVRQHGATDATTGWANSLWLRRAEELAPAP